MSEKYDIEEMIETIKLHDKSAAFLEKSFKISPKVLDAIRSAPRHYFVPKSQTKNAYDDSPLPIGDGQTISQPYIVALMTELLKTKKNYKVLEVGTGSGYQAAVLSRLVKEVYSTEIVESLSKKASQTLKKLKYLNVSCIVQDGNLGWKEHAPFDAIIVTAAAQKIPKSLISQLKVGGRMLIPLENDDGNQVLYIVEKPTEKEIFTTETIDVRFVPLMRNT